MNISTIAPRRSMSAVKQSVNRRMKSQSSHLRKAVVCSVSARRGGVEVVVRLGGEQWLVARIADGRFASGEPRIGDAVLVDSCSEPIRLFSLSSCDHE